MTIQNPLAGGNAGITQNPIVDPKTGRPEWHFLKFITDLQGRVQIALNKQGQVVGVVAPAAQVNLSALLSGGASAGQVLEWNGTAWAPANLPVIPVVPATTPAVSHKWFASYSAVTGAFTETQPGFSDLSGSATPAQLPIATTLAVGAVKPDGSTISVDGTGKISAAAGGGPLRGTVTVNAGGAASGTFSNTGTITGATTGMAVAASCSGLIGLAGSHQVQWNADVSSANTVEVQVTLPNTGVSWSTLTFQVAVFS